MSESNENIFARNWDLFAALGVDKYPDPLPERRAEPLGPLNRTERQKHGQTMRAQVARLVEKRQVLNELSGRPTISLVDMAHARLFGVSANRAFLNDHGFYPGNLLRQDVDMLDRKSLDYLERYLPQIGHTGWAQVHLTLNIFDATRRFSTVPQERPIADRPASTLLAIALNDLNERQRLVFEERLATANPVDRGVLAGELGVSRQRVQQMEAIILARLGTSIGSQVLEQALPHIKIPKPRKPETP